MLKIAMLLPFLGSMLLFAIRFKNRTVRNWFTFAFTLATSVFAAIAVICPAGEAFMLLPLSDSLSIGFKMDGLARVFTGMIAFLWPLATLYAFEYMTHEGSENTFFAFYLLSFGVTIGIATANSLFTLYVFYELLTLSTLFLVTHGMHSKNVYAGRKYVYYSLGAASMGFLAMAGVQYYCGTTEFVYGGIAGMASAPVGTMLTLFLLGFLGFGVKAAIFPLHGWLPTASVAPTPVTALLHAVAVVKAGVFAVARLAYFAFGAELLRGTWAQTVCLAIAAFTIVFGSTMAVREQHLKRRLAYSTCSNLSYVLFGVLLMTPEGLTAGLMHMVYHALMKISLFSCVGAIMVKTGKAYVQDIRGFAKRMPFIIAVFTFCSIELVGIPPFIGFQSKWALATAGLHSGSVMGIVGLCALLISAILTAIYLLMPSLTAYFTPLNENDGLENRSYDPGWQMKAPLLILCVAMLVLAFCSQPLADFLSRVASGLL